MGALGSWYVMQTLPWPKLAVTAASTIIISMNDILVPAF